MPATTHVMKCFNAMLDVAGEAILWGFELLCLLCFDSVKVAPCRRHLTSSRPLGGWSLLLGQTGVVKRPSKVDPNPQCCTSKKARRVHMGILAPFSFHYTFSLFHRPQ